MEDSRNAIGQRQLPWLILSKTGVLSNDEANTLEHLGKLVLKEDYEQISKEVNSYASICLSLLTKVTRDDTIKYLLNLILELLSHCKEFQEALFELRTTVDDDELPYQPFLNYLHNNDEEIKLLAIYNLAILYLIDSDNKSDKQDGLLKLCDSLFSDLIMSTNLNLQHISIQVLSELLTVRNYREIFWVRNNKYIPPLIHLLKNKRSPLQVQYLTLLSLWLLSFNKTIVNSLPLQHNGLIKILITISKDSIKEKIVRLSVAILLNLVECKPVIKMLLLNDSLPVVKNLNNRKWADEELVADLAKLLDILNDNYEKLTSFDEYLLELDSGVMTWSPPHKSKEFWNNYSGRFKQDNYKLFKQLISLMNKIIDDSNSENSNLTADQVQNNNKVLAVICNDIYQIISNVPEALPVLNSIDNSKAKIMGLMTAKDSNLRYEALKTTQILVAHAI